MMSTYFTLSLILLGTGWFSCKSSMKSCKEKALVPGVWEVYEGGLYLLQIGKGMILLLFIIKFRYKPHSELML